MALPMLSIFAPIVQVNYLALQVLAQQILGVKFDL